MSPLSPRPPRRAQFFAWDTQLPHRARRRHPGGAQTPSPHPPPLGERSAACSKVERAGGALGYDQFGVPLSVVEGVDEADGHEAAGRPERSPEMASVAATSSISVVMEASSGTLRPRVRDRLFMVQPSILDGRHDVVARHHTSTRAHENSALLTISIPTDSPPWHRWYNREGSPHLPPSPALSYDMSKAESITAIAVRQMGTYITWRPSTVPDRLTITKTTSHRHRVQQLGHTAISSLRDPPSIPWRC